MENDQPYKDWLAFMKKYDPEGNLGDSFNVYGIQWPDAGAGAEAVRRRSLAREHHEASGKPRHDAADAPARHPHPHGRHDFYPLKQMRLARFEGKQWVLFGEVIGE